MKKEDFLKLGLTEELAKKAAQSSAEELKGFIPKARFDEVNEAKKQLEIDIKTRDTQLEDLKNVNAEGLKAEIEKLQGENKTAKDEYDAEIKKIQIDNAVEKALMGAKAKNIKAVKALLELENAEIDDGAVKGLDDQLKKLRENEESKFLFDAGEPQAGFKAGVGAEKSSGTENDLMSQVTGILKGI